MVGLHFPAWVCGPAHLVGRGLAVLQKHHGGDAFAARVGAQGQNVFGGLFARMRIVVKEGQGQSVQFFFCSLLHLGLQQPPVLALVGADAVKGHGAVLGIRQAVPPPPFQLRTQGVHGLRQVQHDG